MSPLLFFCFFSLFWGPPPFSVCPHFWGLPCCGGSLGGGFRVTQLGSPVLMRVPARDQDVSRDPLPDIFGPPQASFLLRGEDGLRHLAAVPVHPRLQPPLPQVRAPHAVPQGAGGCRPAPGGGGRGVLSPIGTPPQPLHAPSAPRGSPRRRSTPTSSRPGSGATRPWCGSASGASTSPPPPRCRRPPRYGARARGRRREAIGGS